MEHHEGVKMSEQLNLSTFAGAHPTNAQLIDRLQEWGFRIRRTDGVHLVLRGPHGGTLRVLRSGLGRADAALASKAARLLRVDLRTFWDGPDAPPDRSVVKGDANVEGGDDSGDPRPAHDRITALVLAVHVAMDQPLGFSQVLQLCEVPLTRSQVSGASSQLCRDGQLVRIRSGVYQWADGIRTETRSEKRITTTRRPARSATPASVPAPAPPRPTATALQPAAITTTATRPASAQLFEQLFPHGVRMTAELLADLERWAQLTDKLAAAAP